HDAGAALVGGRVMVFGGGEQTSVAAVQAIEPDGVATVTGRLPGPRSDLSAVTAGGTAYILGGYDGAAYDASVLATTDGRRFRTVARLPEPVRYPAVAVLAGQIWVFGGQTPAGITSVIQRVSPGSGQATVAGHLPRPMSGGAAFTRGGDSKPGGGPGDQQRSAQLRPRARHGHDRRPPPGAGRQRWGRGPRRHRIPGGREQRAARGADGDPAPAGGVRLSRPAGGGHPANRWGSGTSRPSRGNKPPPDRPGASR